MVQVLINSHGCCDASLTWSCALAVKSCGYGVAFFSGQNSEFWCEESLAAKLAVL
jgi:hypothetical protein